MDDAGIKMFESLSVDISEGRFVKFSVGGITPLYKRRDDYFAISGYLK